MSPQNTAANNELGSRMISRDNIDQFEKEALDTVKKTLSALEQAIAAWEGAKERPKDLEESYRKYKWMQEELSKWTREFIQKSGRSRGFEERLADLRRLARISFSPSVM